MVDPLSAPGMAIDIRLSTLDAVQQLGPKLANILSGELARLRADSAFAQSVGIATHASAAHSDRLRAEQMSVIGTSMIGLTTQTDMYAEGSRTAAHFMNKMNQSTKDSTDEDNEVDNQQEQEVDYQHEADDGKEGDGAERESVEDSVFEREHLKLVSALQQALLQFQSVALEAGFSGTPLAVVLPAQHWLFGHAPADIQQASGISDDVNRELLVLCLAFDGTLGKVGVVMGLVFRADRWIGSVRACRLQGNNVGHAECCSVHVSQPGDLVSPVFANYASGQVQGLRVKLDNGAEEPAHWSWRADHWSWH